MEVPQPGGPTAWATAKGVSSRGHGGGQMAVSVSGPVHSCGHTRGAAWVSAIYSSIPVGSG